MSDIDTQAPQVDEPAATDTSATVDTSEASTQVNEGTPEASQEVKESDVNAEDTVEEKLYAGKYKSVEDMEKAYTELQSKYGQTTSEKAELAKILNEAFIAPEPQQVQQAQNDDDYEAPDPVTVELDRLNKVTAVQSFILAHPDADPTSMQKVLAEDPIVQQIPSAQAKLEYALLRSQNMSQGKAIAEAEKKATQTTQNKIIEKQAAQVETSNQSQKIDEKGELMQRMSTGSLSDRQQARLEYIRKNLV